MFSWIENPQNALGVFSLNLGMDNRYKIFLSRIPSDDEIESLKSILLSKKINEYLKESYIYIYFDDEEGLHLYSFQDESVHLVSADYNISPKQAVEMIFNKVDIEQAVKELLYWSNIDSYKKFVPVIAEAKMKNKTQKLYAEFPIYARDFVEAQITLDEMDFEEYLYLEDVDE